MASFIKTVGDREEKIRLNYRSCMIYLFKHHYQVLKLEYSLKLLLLDIFS